MKVITNFSGDFSWGMIPYIDKTLHSLSDENSSNILFNGIEWIYNDDIKKPYKDFKRKCLLATWSPCELIATKNYFHFDHYEFFTEVYCACPYTCKFMNNYFEYEKFKYIPFPFTNYSVNTYNKYDATINWVGSIHGNDHIHAIDTICKYNYKFITSQKNISLFHPYEIGANNKATHIGISNDEKLIQMSKCKASLTFNKLYLKSSSINNYGCIKNNKFIKNDAFNNFNNGIMPQFKIRTLEIASCKSLIVCFKDPWNLIDDFFIPNEEFIYFENFYELDYLINDIEKNFEKYIPIINNAFLRQQNYTVEKIFEYIKTNDDSLITWSLKNTI